MSFKKEHIAALETALGMKAGDFDAKYKDAAEADLDLTPFEIAKKDDIAARIKNTGDSRFEEGKKAGSEYFVKGVRDLLGIDKTKLDKKIAPEKFKEVVTSFILETNKIAPDARITALEEDKKKLQKRAEKLEQEKNELEGTYKKESKFSGTKIALLGKAPEKLKIPKEDALFLGMKNNNITIDLDGENVVFKKDGAVLKNEKNLNPMTIDEIAPMIYTPYIDAVGGGAGGTDNPGQAKPGTLAALRKKLEDDGIRPGSEQYMKKITEAQKEAEKAGGKLI